MVKKHLSSLNAPTCWPIKKKQHKWITRPNPGPHALKKCIPLSILIKNLLNHAETTKQAKKILTNKEILINKKIRTNHKFPVGIMDTIEIPKTKEYYRLLLNKKGKFIIIPIKKEETKIKPCKIIGKTILKKKKVQINLYDGTNILVEKDNYKVGESIVLNLSNNKEISNLKLEKNSKAYLTGGKHIGRLATILELNKKGSKTIILSYDKQKIKTSKEHIFIVGDALKEYEK
ncbi:MAG: 30S ribosomal protein S4e [Nanoarchaeota archaeon]|nr:30S ribosomal protein S4e [Nanoarchaeota archaeon]